MPEPKMGENDVLVEVHTAGVNHLDEMIRSGEFKRILHYRMPLILGNEVAGTVVRAGGSVSSFAPRRHCLCPAPKGPHRDLR